MWCFINVTNEILLVDIQPHLVKELLFCLPCKQVNSLCVCVTIAHCVIAAGYPEYDDSFGWYHDGVTGLCIASVGR